MALTDYKSSLESTVEKDSLTGKYTVNTSVYAFANKIKEESVEYDQLIPQSNAYLLFKEKNGNQFSITGSHWVEPVDPDSSSSTEINKNWDGKLYYSINASDWEEWDGTTVNSSSDGKLYLRGENNTKIDTQLKLTGNLQIECIGNVETILDYATVESGNHPVMGENAFKSLLSESFGEYSLVKAPDLPATTLSKSCYENMFTSCTKLVDVPDLPATTLAESCYSGMFRGSSIISVPDLQATTLAVECYSQMFQQCGSITTPIDLIATTLAEGCYRNMFSSCTLLTGTIHCPASVASDVNNISGNNGNNIPSGVTVLYDL